MSQTAKEAIFLNRLLKALLPQADELPTIHGDNKQTLRLLTEESARLATKLKHVDIHTHWLRQEVQQGRIRVDWVPTAQIPADGLTKPLGRQKHAAFVDMIGLTDETERSDVFWIGLEWIIFGWSGSYLDGVDLASRVFGLDWIDSL
jgi:hypothetical protein